MTASLGIGEAKEASDAVIYAVKMCAQMDVDCISRVRNFEKELREFNSDIDNTIEYIGDTKFVELEFYKTLNEQFDYYTTLILSQAVDLLRLFGTEVALNYVENKVYNYKETNSGKHVEDLKAVIQKLKCKENEDSELLTTLVRILNNEFMDKKDSRVIIFLLKRNHCEILSKLLSTKIQQNVDYLIGRTTKEDGKGLNVQSQKKKVMDFSNGKTQVICATTVAEEGLDISACRLVVEYNNVGGEIGHLQRKGRGRAKNAKSVLLTCDQRIKNKFEQNIIRERVMMEALQILDLKSLDWFKTEKNRITEELREQRLIEKVKEKERKLLVNKLYKISCRLNLFIIKIYGFSKCDSPLCYSMDIKVVATSNYVIVDTKIWDKVSVDRLPYDKAEEKLYVMNTAHIGRCFCKQPVNNGTCSNMIGRIVLYENVRLPLLTVKRKRIIGILYLCLEVAFVDSVSLIPDGSELRKPDRKICKNWKEVKQKLFEPEKIEGIHLKEMELAENNYAEVKNLNRIVVPSIHVL